MRYLRIFEADHEMIMIRKESPRLQDQRVAVSQLEGRVAKRSSFISESKIRFGCSVEAVKR